MQRILCTQVCCAPFCCISCYADLIKHALDRGAVPTCVCKRRLTALHVSLPLARLRSFFSFVRCWSHPSQVAMVDETLSSKMVKAVEMLSVMERRAFVCKACPPEANSVVSLKDSKGLEGMCFTCRVQSCTCCYMPIQARASHTTAMCRANQDEAAMRRLDEIQSALRAHPRLRCCSICCQMVESEGGCNTVRCESCGSFICWICGDVIVESWLLDACNDPANQTFSPMFVAHCHFSGTDEMVADLPMRMRDMVMRRRKRPVCSLYGHPRSFRPPSLDEIKRMMFNTVV